MAALPVIPVYRDLLASGWPAALARYPHLAAGLEATYGPDAFGPGGVAGAAARAGGGLLAAVAAAAGQAPWEALAAGALARAGDHLPGDEPDLYLATLLGLAPAATVAVGGRPAIVLGLERFAGPPGPPPRLHYAPDEAPDIVAHEACHVARMNVLGLPPTPRLLSLRDMLLLEGTAVLLTDALAGRPTLGDFMAAADIARHRALEPALWQAVRPDLDQVGMAVFRRYFSAGAPVSGYYLGWSAGRAWLDRTGRPLAELVLTPAAAVLAALGLS